MKNINIVLILVLCSLFSCKKDKKPTNSLDALPAATSTGANTGGCLINGDVFVAKTSYPTQGLNFYYDGEALTISLNKKINDTIVSVFLGSVNLPDNYLHSDTAYILNDSAVNYGTEGKTGSMAIIWGGHYEYATNHVVTGELRFSRFDTAAKIFSGAFWFDAIAVDATSYPLPYDTVHIREGRFDIKL